MAQTGLRRLATRKLFVGLAMLVRGLVLAMVLSALGAVPSPRSESVAPVEQESSGDVLEAAATALRRVQLPRPAQTAPGRVHDDGGGLRSPRGSHLCQAGHHLLNGLTSPLRC